MSQSQRESLETLKAAARPAGTDRATHAKRISTLLLTLAIPASAAFATACYAAAPQIDGPEEPCDAQLYDCDGDGEGDAADPKACR